MGTRKGEQSKLCPQKNPKLCGQIEQQKRDRFIQRSYLIEKEIESERERERKREER